MPLDMMILSLFYTQNTAFAELLRGRAGLGQYHRKDEFLYTCIDVKDLHFPHKYTHPDDIIQQAKRESDWLTKERQVRLEQEECESDAETDAEDGQSSSGKKQGDDNGSVDVGNEDAVEEPKDVKDATLSHFTNVTAVVESEKKGKEKNVSQRSLAQADDIEDVPTMNAYLVKGVRGKIYAVTLEPEKCQCPSTGLCYHIMAVKIKLELPLEKNAK